jgi:hypothetical protein
VFIKRVLMGLMGYPKGIHIPIMDFSNPVVKNLASVVTGNAVEMSASRYRLRLEYSLTACQSLSANLTSPFEIFPHRPPIVACQSDVSVWNIPLPPANRCLPI